MGFRILAVRSQYVETTLVKSCCATNIIGIPLFDHATAKRAAFKFKGCPFESEFTQLIYPATLRMKLTGHSAWPVAVSLAAEETPARARKMGPYQLFIALHIWGQSDWVPPNIMEVFLSELTESFEDVSSGPNNTFVATFQVRKMIFWNLEDLFF